MSDTTTTQTPAAEPTALPITSPPADTTPPAATTTTEKPLHTGIVGEIKDATQAVEYIKVLEKKVTDMTLAAQAKSEMPGMQPMTTATPPTKSIEEEIEDQIFSNPKEALRKFKEHIRAEVRQDDQKRDLKNQFWNDFWNENPDLKGLEKIVQSVEREHATELAPLTFSEARKKLAAETRKTIDLVKSKTGVRETEIPGGSATIIGSSNGSASSGGQQAPKVLSFVDQIRGMQRGRGK